MRRAAARLYGGYAVGLFSLSCLPRPTLRCASYGVNRVVCLRHTEAVRSVSETRHPIIPRQAKRSPGLRSTTKVVKPTLSDSIIGIAASIVSFPHFIPKVISYNYIFINIVPATHFKCDFLVPNSLIGFCRNRVGRRITVGTAYYR